jgi:WD40 repeat protein
LPPSGERLVTVEGTDIKIWQVGDGTLVSELAPPEETASLSHGALSPDGQRLVTLGDALRVWRISGEPVLLKTVQAGFVSDYPIAMGFSADGGSLLAALMDGSLLTYRLDDGALLPPVPVGEPPLSSLALAARQSLAAVGRGDKQIDLVKPDGNLILNLSKEKSPATSLALSPDGSMFSSATADNAVLVRRTSDGATVQTLKPVEGTSQMVFSPDGSLLALRAKNGISLWMLENGSQMVVIPGYTLSFSADGGLLATSFAEEGRELTRIRKIQDGLTLSTIKTGGTDLSFSPDGQLLAISGPTLTLWNVADGSQLAGPPELENRFSPFSRLAFSPDGRLLAQLSPDGVLSLWGVP